MRFRFLLLAVVCGLSLIVIPQVPAPAEPQDVASEIDFDMLHSQATAALESLRQPRESHVASAVATEF